MEVQLKHKLEMQMQKENLEHKLALEMQFWSKLELEWRIQHERGKLLLQSNYHLKTISSLTQRYKK